MERTRVANCRDESSRIDRSYPWHGRKPPCRLVDSALVANSSSNTLIRRSNSAHSARISLTSRRMRTLSGSSSPRSAVRQPTPTPTGGVAAAQCRARATGPGPHLVDQRRPLSQQSLACPMQYLHVELSLYLEGHEAHRRPRRSFRDRLGISVVVLLRLDVGTYSGGISRTSWPRAWAERPTKWAPRLRGPLPGLSGNPSPFVWRWHARRKSARP